MGAHVPAAQDRRETLEGGERRIHVEPWSHPFAEGLGLATWRIEQPIQVVPELETAWVLLRGSARLSAEGASLEAHRASVFDDPPAALLAPAGCTVRIEPGPGGAELAVPTAAGGRRFAPRTVRPDEVRREQRGQGSLHDAAHREVRTIVDDVDGPPEARLVVGEVVTAPGRWSSYPPHHHAQPEVYHYRFSRPEGYGHAELGEEVRKVRHGDSTIIAPGETHAQCAAPGYGMWYLWAIRHLDDERYTRPTFAPEHLWTLEPGAEHWWPSFARAPDVLSPER